MSLSGEDAHVLSDQLNPFHVITKVNGIKSYSGIGPVEPLIYQVSSHDDFDMTLKGSERHYTYIFSTFTGIDLSNNQLSREIPLDFGKLKGLMYLNLSMNKLDGIIPSSFGEMRKLESLNLSTNRISGRIPAEMQLLTFLSYLNLSNNNLSGSIPQGGQMTRFDKTSYSGNLYLEGCPLPKKCGWQEFAPHPPPNGLQDRNEDDRNQILWYEVGLLLSHVAGFFCVMLLLAVRKGWRKKYFQRVDKILKFLFPCIRNKRL